MRFKFAAALAAITMAVPVALPAPAVAQPRDYRWNGDRQGWDASHSYRPGRYKERRLGRDDRIYRGRDGRYYCRRNDGTTGLVIGGVAGGLLGNALTGSTLGTLVGGAGGALLGRSVDRGQVRCR
ncbi:MAG: glycine zipper 2TM domain-containing protein [Candidatus Sphingomonas colombiensis]|nr:glycine zipper 2TM domain-containing protein [Sphingomonas sp.]WEK43743.1 MAG: glycine zipper 2TM domain-containing protein [Sphingomonas sp.]